MPVLKFVHLGFALLLLAGCSTARRTPPPAPDWEGTNALQTVPPVPPPVIPQPQPLMPPPVRTNQFPETWVSLGQWSRANGFAPPQRVVAGTQASYTVTTPQGVLALRHNSRVARWNGMELQLGFAPQETNGHFRLHTLDLQKNFQPLLAPAPLPPKDQRVIVIDPGHGGANPGAQSVAGKHNEKEFTLDWALRLRPLLETNGWTVFLTRTNDTDVALSNRVNFAEAHHANLFISLHFNSAAPDTRQAGLETYCLTPTGMPSNLTRNYEDDVTLTFPNGNFDAQNLQLATRLHRALLPVAGNKDRGIRRARFMGVLLKQNRPAVLLEGGYLSNPAEARLIGTPAYRQKLAEAIARALE